MKKGLKERIALVACFTVAGGYACGAIAVDQERENQPVTDCLDGQIQDRGGAKSGILDAAAREGVRFDDSAAQEVAVELHEQEAKRIHPDTWVSVGVASNGQPLIARIGSCATNFPEVSNPSNGPR